MAVSILSLFPGYPPSAKVHPLTFLLLLHNRVPYGTIGYHMVPYGTICHMWLCRNCRRVPIRRLYATYTQLYARPIRPKYTPDSPIRSLYVRLYAGPYTPEYCFAWCWPPCSLQKRSSKMLPHLCKKCCHPMTVLNGFGGSAPLADTRQMFTPLS